MLMVISPAKTLDYETPPATPRFTLPEHLDHAQVLIEQLRDFSPAQIAELMHLSDKLAGLNAARFGSWQAEFTPENAKQALLAFKGDVYTGLAAIHSSMAIRAMVSRPKALMRCAIPLRSISWPDSRSSGTIVAS